MLVERGQEAGAVGLGEGRRAADRVTHRASAQVRHDGAYRHGVADAVGGEGLAIGRDDGGCAGFETAVSEQNVGGDDDMFIRRMIDDMGDNIIIGSVEAVVDDLAGNEGVIGDAYGAVADQQHRDIIARCDFIYFVFYGAGIGVDQNM